MVNIEIDDLIVKIFISTEINNDIHILKYY